MAITRSSSAIPVVDFSDILSGSKDLSSCPQVKEFHSALSTVGFVFLKNHGINKEMVGFISTIAVERTCSTTRLRRDLKHYTFQPCSPPPPHSTHLLI